MSSSDQHICGEPVKDQMLLKPNKPNLTELGPAQPPLVIIFMLLLSVGSGPNSGYRYVILLYYVVM